MDRPRFAAVVSAAAASAAAFSVVSHWRLVGTLAGAALVPVIYTLVSHWSSAGLDGAGRWVRRRVSRSLSLQRGSESDEGLRGLEGGAPERGSVAAPQAAARRRGGGRRATGAQWLLAASALVASVVSVCALIGLPRGETVEKVVVQRVVVEKTVTVTTENQGRAPEAAAAEVSAEETGAGDVSSSDGSVADAGGPDDPVNAAPGTTGVGDGVEADDDSPAATAPLSPEEDGATASTAVTTEDPDEPAGGEASPSTPTPASTVSAP